MQKLYALNASANEMIEFAAEPTSSMLKLISLTNFFSAKITTFHRTNSQKKSINKIYQS